jgi:hypothetical protein
MEWREGGDDLMMGSVRTTAVEDHLFPNEREWDVAAVQLEERSKKKVKTDSDRHFLGRTGEHMGLGDSNSWAAIVIDSFLNRDLKPLTEGGETDRQRQRETERDRERQRETERERERDRERERQRERERDRRTDRERQYEKQREIEQYQLTNRDASDRDSLHSEGEDLERVRPNRIKG